MPGDPVTKHLPCSEHFYPLGEQLLQEECAAAEEHFDPSSGQCILFAGGYHGCQHASVDEELYIYGKTVIWSAGGVIRKRLTVEEPILQATWCSFQHSGPEATLCLLHSAALTAYTAEGELVTLPLPAPFTRLWPLPHGLLLTGAPGWAPCLLVHLREGLQAVRCAQGGATSYLQRRQAGWEGEALLWTSRDAPWVATYNQAAGRLAAWQVRALPRSTGSGLGGGAPNMTLPPQTPGLGLQARPQPEALHSPAPTPPLASTPPGARGPKRLSLRLANGALSPAAFSPVPRAAAGGAPPAAAATMVLPPREDALLFALAWEQHLPPDACPTEGHLASDADGAPLLCLLSPTASTLTALRLPSDPALSAKPSLAFQVAAVSAAAVIATRRPPTASGDQLPGAASVLRDLLILRPDGTLVLHVGARVVCTLNLTPPPLPPAASGATRTPAGVVATPSRRMSIVGAESMELSDDDNMSTSDLGETPEPERCGTTPDAPWEPAALKDAVGDRVTVVGRGAGPPLRVTLPCACSDPLTATALEALALVLPQAAVHELSARLLTSPGGGSGDCGREWASFAEVLQQWLTRPSAADHGSGSCGPPPSLAASPAAAPPPPSPWAALLQSSHHRRMVSQRRYGWLHDGPLLRPSSLQPGATPAIPPLADSAEAHQVLQALHAVYEDCKLHSLRWRYLPRLARLLANIAAALGAGAYLDQYTRDLGPARLQPWPGAQTPGPEAGAAARPASMQRALQALLQGRPHQAHLPPLVARRAPCLRRSQQLLELFAILAAAGAACAEALAAAALQQPAGAEPPAASAPDITQAQSIIQGAAEQVVAALVHHGWSAADLDSLPVGAALPLREALYRCRAQPPTGWPAEAYMLVGRADIAATLATAATAPEEPTSPLPTAFASPFGRWAATSPKRKPKAPGAAGKPAAPAPGSARVGFQLPAEEDSDVSAPDDGAAGKTTDYSKLRHFGLPYCHRLHIPDEGIVDQQKSNAALDGRSGLTEALLDGMEGIAEGPAKLRWPLDLRLQEVRRLLASAAPVAVVAARAPGAGEPEAAAAQQARLLALSLRTMALPFGRGAFTLGTLRPLPTEPLAIPPLCLAGRLPQQHNATIALDLTHASSVADAAPDLTNWPQFHNGVAAGLRLAEGASQLTRTWVVYNKPKDASFTHAGMLMGLGLTGQLRCLSPTDLYHYLSLEHEATSVGVLLGSGAAHAGRADAVISKMLFLHLPSRHPATYPEFEVSPLLQAAALLGIGLLYRGSSHRLTTEIMLEEIGRRPGGGAGETASGGRAGDGAVAHDREGYALAAGLALGLINLGKGRSAVGLSDLRIEDRLRYYMLGGSDPADGGKRHQVGRPGTSLQPRSGSVFGPGLIGFDPTLDGGDLPELGGPGSAPAAAVRLPSQDTPAAAVSASQVVLEGQQVNLDVTSPGTTLALGLMFLRTHDAAIAASFVIPDTAYALGTVRPDLIALRLLARCLVMWDAIQPTAHWMQSQLPPLLQEPLKLLDSDALEPGVDREAVGQAQLAGLTGLALALGIRYAGTADAQAAQLLRSRLLHLLHLKLKVPDPTAAPALVWGKVDKQAVESAVGVLALALATVMAGTGDLPTLRLLRGLRSRLTAAPALGPLGGSGALLYGAHTAVSLALGFLFLGAGAATFGTSDAAVAALVIALFPRLPQSPTDHRCHLQALRHMYVLAVEPRCLEAVDIDTWGCVHVPLTVLRRPAPGAAAPPPPLQLTAPALLPEAHQVTEVRVCGPRYWELVCGGGGEAQSEGLAALLRQRRVYVQRRSGALPYADDPSGVRSLLSRSFQAASSPARGGEDDDLNHLCATFCADAFVTTFAEQFSSASAPRSAGAASVSGSPGQEWESFCRAMLLECITEDKTALLQSYLFLYTTVQNVVGVDSSGQQCGGERAPAAVALWSLKLALAYYSSSLASAAAVVHDQLLGAGGEAEAWRPLLGRPFLEALALRLRAHWRRLGFAPSRGPSPTLRRYLTSAALPTAAEAGGAAVGEAFCSFLALEDVPTPGKYSSAVATVRQTLQGSGIRRSVLSSGAILPLLSSLLPGAPVQTLQQVASCAMQDLRSG